MTTGLIFDVLKKYEPDHLLLKEAKNEVLTTQLQLQRLQHVLQRLSTSQLVIKTLHKFSPFSLPLFVEIAHQRISTESLETRIQKIQRSWSQV
jgi:ATP-dependent Lhr-like helicase